MKDYPASAAENPKEEKKKKKTVGEKLYPKKKLGGPDA